jgi:hypothetical protein
MVRLPGVAEYWVSNTPHVRYPVEIPFSIRNLTGCGFAMSLDEISKFFGAAHPSDTPHFRAVPLVSVAIPVAKIWAQAAARTAYNPWPASLGCHNLGQ